jgi:H+/Na+-translocating ferredoxin:NAD+ oxidoreductase subunit G
MKSMLNFGFRIAIFAACSALILAGIYSFTAPLVRELKVSEIQNSLKELVPEAIRFHKITKENNTHYYKGYNKNNKLVSYILPVNGKGYSSTIEMLVAVTPAKNIINVTVLSQQETPGLGTRIIEVKENESKPWFLEQFVSKKASALKLKKDGGTIDAITGATISSKAVVDSVANSVENFKK